MSLSTPVLHARTRVSLAAAALARGLLVDRGQPGVGLGGSAVVILFVPSTLRPAVGRRYRGQPERNDSYTRKPLRQMMIAATAVAA